MPAGPSTCPEPSEAGSIPLRRNRNFQLLWTGSAAAFLGLFSAEIAFSLSILALTGSPGLTSLFMVVQTTTSIVVGIPAGRMLDRHDRRRILVLTESVRALTVATVVAAFWLGVLTFVQLLLVAVVLGAVLPFGLARMLLLRTAVPNDQLTSAVTAEEVRTNAAELSGPPLGGFLYGLAHALPFLFMTAMCVVSAATACSVRVPHQERKDPAALKEGMFAGIVGVMRDRTMRAAVFMIMLVNSIAWPAQLIVVVLLRERGTPPWRIGLALSGFAIGALAGTALVRVLHRLLQPGLLLLGVVLFEVPVLLAMPVPLGSWWVGGICVCFGLGLPSLRVLIDILIIRQIPDTQRGRALSGVMTLFGLSVPVATACSGLLLQYFSPATALTVLAAALLAGAGYAVSRRALRQARWPQPSAD